LPRILKEARPDLTIAQFWHIPWPNAESFRICPWGNEVVRGLLGNALLGFQIQNHCNNFFTTVERGVEAVVDYEQFCVNRRGHRTLVKPFPISVDQDAIQKASQSPAVRAQAQRLKQELGLRHQLVGIGVDRLDYTKGIPERFRAIERFLEKYPEYHKRFTFLQIGPISRIHIPEYKALNDELYHLMVDINGKYAVEHWTPIRILKFNYPRQDLLAFFQLADLCITSSLHDGMNLVAKEFIAGCREDSALILSQFTGAARELEDALLVNPYHTDGFADAVRTALEMPQQEKERRIRRMREIMAENNVFDWAAKVVTEISRLS
jgi:trehalose 6-phosphate synthase